MLFPLNISFNLIELLRSTSKVFKFLLLTPISAFENCSTLESSFSSCTSMMKSKPSFSAVSENVNNSLSFNIEAISKIQSAPINFDS